MPKRYGIKDKDLVVSHIITLVMTGRLRGGDRIDRNEIAGDLGLSRVPVQEAVVQLEHDGILCTRYHRGAYVEPFDEAAVREHHELYGVLTGIASARAAADPAPRILPQLSNALQSMRTAKDAKAFHQASVIYRRTINKAYAGPRLRAAIRGSLSFAPAEFWIAHPRAKSDFLPGFEDETAAIERHDAAAARELCARRGGEMAAVMLTELRRRGVLTGVQTPSDSANSP